MKTYRTNDGEIFKATDARDAVRKLRGLSQSPERTPEAFMVEVAARVMQQNGTLIATDNPTHFVAGLLQSGLLAEVQE